MAKLKERFGNIDERLFEKLESKDRQPIAKYNNMIKKMDEWVEEIEDLKYEIEVLEKKIFSYGKECKDIYEANKHLEKKYSLIFNVSINRKKLKDNLIVNYWMINLKYKGYNKSIYLGNEEDVRRIVNEELKENNYLEKEELKSQIYDMCYDKLYDLVMSEKNLFNNKIVFKDLI
jgi:FtsZ-binding cell division protein ZapB